MEWKKFKETLWGSKEETRSATADTSELSVANEYSNEIGTKVEIKNMNSLKSLEKAIDYEIMRQSKQIEKGESVIQETRHWDENKQVTISMRTKEGSADYRYFSDPDLPNMIIDDGGDATGLVILGTKAEKDLSVLDNPSNEEEKALFKSLESLKINIFLVFFFNLASLEGTFFK